MDSEPSVTAHTRIAPDAPKLAWILGQACPEQEQAEQVENLIGAILRKEAFDSSALPPAVVEVIPRLEAMDRRSLEMIGHSLVGEMETEHVFNHPYFVARFTLTNGWQKNLFSRDDVRRLLKAALAHQPVPTDLPAICLEVGDVLSLVIEKDIEAIWNDFFRHPESDHYEDP